MKNLVLNKFCSMAIAAGALFLSLGCRVVSPGVPEQQKLIADGTFPAGAPAWISPRVNLPAGQTVNNGVIPQYYSGPDASREVAENVQTAALKNREVTQDLPAPEPKAKSPLDRINSTCPGIETEVTATLTVTEIDARVAKYQDLTTRCPGSTDLWQWLGTDYARQNKLPEARRAFEQALIIDSTNDAAKQGMADVEARINAPLSNSEKKPAEK